MIQVLVLLCLSGCGQSGPEVVPSGDWAQAMPPEDINLAELQVDATGAATARFGIDTVTNPNEVVIYCTRATLPRLALDSDGHFNVNGTMIGRGNGLTSGPPVPAAQFSGTVTGNTMQLTVTTVNGVWGRFTLTFGAALKGVRLCVD